MKIRICISELGERASVTLKPGATQEQERPQTVPKASKVSFGGRFGYNYFLFNNLTGRSLVREKSGKYDIFQDQGKFREF